MDPHAWTLIAIVPTVGTLVYEVQVLIHTFQVVPI
jgi:hypothetical protein